MTLPSKVGLNALSPWMMGLERQTQDITEDAEGGIQVDPHKRSDQEGQWAVLEDFLEEVAWSEARVVDIFIVS